MMEVEQNHVRISLLTAGLLFGLMGSPLATAALMFTEITNNLRDISSTGTLSTITNNDDSVQSSVPIGFSFELFGSSYTSVNLSSNGFLNFNSTNTSSGCCSGQELANGSPLSLQGPLVAGLWDDLNPGSAGDVRYQTFASEFVVGFYGVRHFGNTNQVNFEMILRNDNSVELQYGLVQDDGSNSSVGVANAANDASGDQLYFGNAPSVLSNRGFSTNAFEPPPSAVPTPATLALLGLGLAGIGWTRRKT